jgi:hypothetical protein
VLPPTALAIVLALAILSAPLLGATEIDGGAATGSAVAQEPPRLRVESVDVGPAGLASVYLRVSMLFVNDGKYPIQGQLEACVESVTPTGYALGRKLCGNGNPTGAVSPGGAAQTFKDLTGTCPEVDLTPWCQGLPMIPHRYKVTACIHAVGWGATDCHAGMYVYTPLVKLP